MKGLLIAIIIMLFTILGLFIFNQQQVVWPKELDGIPRVDKSVKIFNTKKTGNVWTIQYKQVEPKVVNDYIVTLNSSNFALASEEEFGNNILEESHQSPNVDKIVLLRYSLNQLGDLTVTITLKK